MLSQTSLRVKSTVKAKAVRNETGKLFIEHTKYEYLERSGQTKGKPQPPLEAAISPNEPLIDLPNPSGIMPHMSVRDAINSRKSIREYSDSPLTQLELSYLLWSTQGIKTIISGTATLRTVPSAGARHAFETYLLLNNVAGLKDGIYRYKAGQHKLAQQETNPTIRDVILKACFDQEFVLTCAVVFIWSAEVHRMTWRYGERGYRYLYLDAGHVCQNLYLSAESIDCGVCAIGAFEDDEMNRLLGLDGIERFVIYMAGVGKK